MGAAFDTQAAFTPLKRVREIARDQARMRWSVSDSREGSPLAKQLKPHAIQTHYCCWSFILVGSHDPG